MTAELLQCHTKFYYTFPTNSAFSTFCSQPRSFNPLLYTSDLSLSLSFLLSIILSSLPGLIDINLEHSQFPMVLHVALRMSEQEALWPTSISVTCQDLWEMESKPDHSESVLLKPTPGPLWRVMDEYPHPHPPPPRLHPTSLTLSSIYSSGFLLLSPECLP